MKRNLVPLLGIAFVVALISTGLFYGLVVGRLKGSSADAANQREVVVAARDLPRGAVIKPADVKTVQSVARPGDLQSSEQAAGLTVLEPIREGQPLRAGRLSPPESRGGASLAIPEGMRAVSVRATDSNGVVGLMESGHRVDVQVIRREGDGSSLRTLLENVEVFAKDPNSENRQRVVTLLVKASEAERLSLADATGAIRLVLRNPRETSPVRAEAPPRQRVTFDVRFAPLTGEQREHAQVVRAGKPVRVSVADRQTVAIASGGDEPVLLVTPRLPKP
ncbi:MAG TPA: Flp pilus assembly protein CpaB [Solibacterales bacterium]|nr:Flp pilus assembly protein CpaB [Bryobacterales bacterium]